eukprot:scaffold18950_cov122-Isochrysis_galbana.AAC.4
MHAATGMTSACRARTTRPPLGPRTRAAIGTGGGAGAVCTMRTAPRCMVLPRPNTLICLLLLFTTRGAI